jgi:F0F1-type ATP synthase delta subunit
MTTKQIKKLAMASYTGKILDLKKINRITKLLTRADLKRYIRFLKSLEKSKTVTVVTSNSDVKTELNKKLKQIFPGKRLEFSKDESLIAGIKLIDNDNIYDFNLKNTFENLVSYINR